MNSIKKGFVFSILILSLFACLPLRPAQGIFVEPAGTVTIESWVPVYVLYNPPGGNSSAKITISTGGSWSISFDTDLAGSEIDGGVAYNFEVEYSVSTPVSAREHLVVVRKASVIYNRYLVVTPRRSYYKLEFSKVDTFLGSYNHYEFSVLHDHGLYLEQNLIGTPGPYGEEQHISSSPSTISFSIHANRWTKLGVGIKFKYAGTTFKFGVLIGVSNTRSLTMSNTYCDKTQVYDIIRYYNADFEYLNATTLSTAPLIWFSE